MLNRVEISAHSPNTTKDLPPLPSESQNKPPVDSKPNSRLEETHSQADLNRHWEYYHSRRVTPEVIEQEEEEAKRRAQETAPLHDSTRENQTKKRPVVKPLNIRKHKLNVLVDIPEEDEIPQPQASTSQAIATRPLSGGPLYFILDDEVEWDASAETQSPDDSPFGRVLHSREYYYGLLDEGEIEGSPAASEDKVEGSAASSPHDAQRTRRRHTSILDGQLLSPQEEVEQ